MAHFVCPRCQRANPGEAVFCHYDGAELRPVGGSVRSANVLPREFVFPSGRQCKTFDELAQGCHQEWGQARDLLRQGAFSQFLAGAGRLDLAKAAKEAQTQSNDPDIALAAFLGRLPVSQSQAARLDLKPRRLVLGKIKAGESVKVQLTVTNQGKGVLQGTLKVTEGGKWLHVDDGSSNGQCMLNVPREQQIRLRVDTHGLAAPQSYSARLTVITNGGIVEVPVRIDLVSHPFTRQPYQGASTPREIAERMRSNPKPAVPLLESGEVERWFQTNGWTYPARGPIAKGVAAVQQFFEGMGLSKPPPLQLSETEARFSCRFPEVVRRQVTLRTSAKKWVYAQVDSDVPWIRVTTPNISGPQQAVIQYEVDTTLMEGGGLQQGTLKLLANAGQKLNMPVRVDTGRVRESLAGGVVQLVMVGAALGVFYRLFLTVFGDVWGRLLMAPNGLLRGLLHWWEPPALAGASPGSTPGWWAQPIWGKVPPDPLAAFGDTAFLFHFVLVTWWIGMIAGVVLAWRRGGRSFDVIYGAVAGAFAGIIAAGTIACLMPLLDPLAWVFFRLFSGMEEQHAVVWTPLWILFTVGLWAIQGAVIGFLLSLLGRKGRQLMGYAARPAAWLMGAIGLKRAAAFLAMH